MNETWVGIRRQVLELAQAPAAEKVFGHLGHGYALADPLSHQELADLEQQIGVRLPEDYRDFLVQVAAGGAGPAYGVFPVRRGEDGRWSWHGDGADMIALDRLGEPFPVVGPSPARLEAMREEEPDEEAFEDIEDFDSAYEAWEARWEDLFWSDDRTVGAICLCHIGCAGRKWLVVSGTAAGQIWNDDRADDVDLACAEGPDGEPLSFAAWYLSWLAEAMATTQGQ